MLKITIFERMQATPSAYYTKRKQAHIIFITVTHLIHVPRHKTNLN